MIDIKNGVAFGIKLYKYFHKPYLSYRESCFMKSSRIIFILVLVFVFGPSLSKAQSNCIGGQIFTARSCVGDASSQAESDLFQIVNKYRKANDRPELKLSPSLSMLANRRVLDLKFNMKSLTHSWSNCPYDIKNEKSWKCVIDSPTRLNTGYKGQGYETLYRTASGRANPTLAVQAWSKSPLHNSIILNLSMFKDMAWDEVGVAVDGQFAVLWFGYLGAAPKVGGEAETGLGVSFDKAVTGLSKILSINQASAQVEANSWKGASADKKIRLEIHGARKDINEAAIAVRMNLDAGKLSQQSQTAISTLLKNLFPEWADRDAWIASSVAAIGENRSVSKTKLVRKIAVELHADGPNSLTLTVRPESQKNYVDFF